MSIKQLLRARVIRVEASPGVNSRESSTRLNIEVQIYVSATDRDAMGKLLQVLPGTMVDISAAVLGGSTGDGSSTG